MVEHKKGSRKAQVHAAYDAKGAPAAIALGAKLELAPGTVKAWISAWSKEKAPTKPKAQDFKEKASRMGIGIIEGPPIKTSKDRPLPEGTKRVCWHTDRNVRATVKELGPQQSTIKWDNGNVRHELNYLLSPLTVKEIEQEERKRGKIK